MKGFTLIETVLYIAISSIILTSTIPLTQMLVNSTDKSIKNAKRDEFADYVFYIYKFRQDICEYFQLDIKNCSTMHDVDRNNIDYQRISFEIENKIYKLNYYTK